MGGLAGLAVFAGLSIAWALAPDLAWTEANAAALRDSAADARHWTTTGQVELRITGTATPLAKKELAALGWRVVENSRF